MEKKVYAQVYSLLKTQRDGILTALGNLSAIGYDGVELMGTLTDGVSQDTFKRVLADLKLDVISSHGLRDEHDFAWAAEVGARYTDIRMAEHSVDRDTVLCACEQLNKDAELRKKFGLKSVIHNHANELFWVDHKEGTERVYDLLLENTDPTLVGFEFDVGWGARAGVDVVEYVKKYAGRFPLIHVKECNAVGKTEEEMEHFPKKVLDLGAPKMIHGTPYFNEQQVAMLEASRVWNVKLGTGLIDWKALIAACEAQGTVAYINERECHNIEGVYKANVLQCAQQDYEFLRSL